jgi:SAM-dependent methyltransferase
MGTISCLLLFPAEIDCAEESAMLTAARHTDEVAAINARRYSLLVPAALLATQERQRAIADLFVRVGWFDLAKVRLLEVGCGTGNNLLEFLQFGFRPEHLQGVELLPAPAEQARRNLPSSVRITLGDAAGPAAACVPEGTQDIVYQSTVFTSLLDDAFQERLADRMWRWLRPGGGILWYDFTVNNPFNPDVRGVPVERIRELFPQGEMRVRRLTLAPPLARVVTRIHPELYTALNICGWLRTHVLVWVEKPLAVCLYLIADAPGLPVALSYV